MLVMKDSGDVQIRVSTTTNFPDVVYGDESTRLAPDCSLSFITFAVWRELRPRYLCNWHSSSRYMLLICLSGLIDHFFLDVEDRIRQALSRKAPERLVSRQMKILREQWVGLGLSLDYALGLSAPSARAIAGHKAGDSDAEMAAAIWRNFLGARGAQGIADPGTGRTRHAVNISGEYAKPKISSKKPEASLRVLEETEDGSGVYDFVGNDVQLYVQYPELMLTLTAYIRRELTRLENISDEQILKGEGVSNFGKVVVNDIA